MSEAEKNQTGRADGGSGNSGESEGARQRIEKKRKSWAVWALYLLALVLFTWIYVFLGAGLILTQEEDARERLQNPYLEAVYETAAMRERARESGAAVTARFTSWLPQYTDGIIDPLWPWLVQGFSDEPPEELLRKGRWVNLFLCCGLIVLLGVAAARAFSFAGAAAMILMGGFGIILERSTYFTPDALYNLLVLIAWLCGLSLTRQNQLWIYGVFGVLLGLVYLARPPIWPILSAFLIVSLVRTVIDLVQSRRGIEDRTLWVNSNQLVGLAIMVTAFLLVAGPRLSYAGANFGQPLLSFSHYETWSDSAEEASRLFRRQANPEAAETISWRQRPGPVRFIEENGAAALFERAFEGAREQLRSSVLGRQGWIIFYGFFVFFAVAAIHRWAMWRKKDEIWKVRGASARWMLLFLVVGILLTLFHVGMGNPVVPSNAMTTALFLPILMTFVWIAERYRRQLQRSSVAPVVNFVYSGLMVLPILWVTYRAFAAVRVALAG